MALGFCSRLLARQLHVLFALMLTACCFCAAASGRPDSSHAVGAADGDQDEVVRVRRDIHMFPETAFEEFRTAKIVADYLRSHNITVMENVATTGVVGLIHGRYPGPTIALRADMDALPLQDTNDDLPYRSRVPGKMHACGHDGHVAMLLVAAKRIARRRPRLHGNVKLLFQPAEEHIGGAQPMVEEGALLNPNVSRVFGMHLNAGLQRGLVALRDGPMMANVDSFSITLTSPGGHGGLPAGTPDVVLAGGHLVSQIHTIVSRDIVATRPAVVSIGEFRAGSAPNIMPTEAVLTGTVRTFDSESRTLIQQRLRVLADGVAISFRVGARVQWFDGYPMVANDPRSAAMIREAARKIVGSERVVEMPNPVAAGDDFSFFILDRPGAYFVLGSAIPGSPREHHQTTFRFDDSVLGVGVDIWEQLVEDLMIR